MKNKIKRIITFGSNGFVAASLKKYLKSKKIKSKFISKENINLNKTESYSKIRSLIKDDDCIVFISAIAPVKDMLMFDLNINMMKNFIMAVKDINFKQLIYISSDAVFEDTKKKLMKIH